MAKKTGDEIAFERIQEAAKTGETVLDLYDLGLEAVPTEIGQLPQLTKLFLSGNKLTCLPAEIGKLSQLEGLYLSSNRLSNLPAEIEKLKKLKELYLVDNLFDIMPTEIGKLRNLVGLHLSKNQLSSLPVEIGQLTQLMELHLAGNELRSLPAEIGRLRKLTGLHLPENQLSSLPSEIGQLTQLTKLDISRNQFSSLTAEVGKLTQLTQLYLSENQLSSLPENINNLKALERFSLLGNPLGFPPEIVEKWEDAQSILNYLVLMRDGKRRTLAETKMLVLGQGSVGKTSLIRRLLDDTFNNDERKTEGISINHWQVKNTKTGKDQPETLRVNIWDFGGQEIMHATHQFFLTKRSLYLLVLDARISQEDNRVEYWLKIIQSFGGDSPILIVGNKNDQHPLDIDASGLEKKYPNIVGILETSAAKGKGLEELKAVIIEQVNKLPHVRDALPSVWFNVKDQLEELGEKQNYILQDKYVEICTEGKIRDETSQRTLISFLHDLGIILHFQDDDRLAALGILNPHWVTNGVYKILNTREILDNKGVMDLPMLDNILETNDYPRDKRFFIVEMMQKFELCYEIDRDKFLIPDLLPKSEPYVGEKEWEGALAFEYHYNVLPSSIITRFIVRMNEYIHKTVWRSGVVLQKDRNTALVKADIEEKKIFIWVNGNENTRRDMLAAIRMQLSSIHKTIVKIEAREKVPVPGEPNVVVDFEHLLQMESMGESTFFPEGLGYRLSISKLLNGVVSEVEKNNLISTIELEKLSGEGRFIKIESPPEIKPIIQSKYYVTLQNIIILPKVIGRFVFDVFGRKDAVDSSCTMMGWVVVLVTIMLIMRLTSLEVVGQGFINVWRFFFPVK